MRKDRMERNGIVAPMYDFTISGQVWATCDRLRADGASLSQSVLFAALPDLARGTVIAQFQRWKTYHGLAKRRGPNKGRKPGPPSKAEIAAGKREMASRSKGNS